MLCESTGQIDLRIANLWLGSGLRLETGNALDCRRLSFSEVVFGKPRHLPRFIDSNRDQVATEQDPLQVTGAEADLEDARPFDEGEDAYHPVFPATQ